MSPHKHAQSEQPTTFAVVWRAVKTVCGFVGAHVKATIGVLSTLIGAAVLLWTYLLHPAISEVQLFHQTAGAVESLQQTTTQTSQDVRTVQTDVAVLSAHFEDMRNEVHEMHEDERQSRGLPPLPAADHFTANMGGIGPRRDGGTQ
ncbi:MAG TPA: hypothetical protein VHQ47_08825 [Phycisphaerae bacterium]|nr:hypothetical protein [Phycisphaerae bacterium]